MACGTRKENKKEGSEEGEDDTVCAGKWVEQLERIGEGGAAEQSPTEGGTDEVREKWREKDKKS